MIGYGTQFMATITWSKKSPSQSIYIGPKVHIVATWNTIKQKILMTPLGNSTWHALPNLPKLADILALVPPGLQKESSDLFV